MRTAQDHDQYGKKLLCSLFGNRWDALDPARSVEEGGVRADLDGIIRRADDGFAECAVEIEARVFKQIRGAIVDLALHPAPKKLLVIIKAQPLGSADKITKHCAYIWQQMAGTQHGQFEMTVLEGTGQNPKPDFDKKLLENTLRKLGIAVS